MLAQRLVEDGHRKRVQELTRTWAAAEATAAAKAGERATFDAQSAAHTVHVNDFPPEEAAALVRVGPRGHDDAARCSWYSHLLRQRRLAFNVDMRAPLLPLTCFVQQLLSASYSARAIGLGCAAGSAAA